MIQRINLMKHRILALFPLFLFVGALRAAGADCDRDCLRGMVTQYLNALAANKPAALPVDPKVRFTEDSAELHLGEGLWKTATAIRPYRQDVLDTVQGIAATEVIVEESGSPAFLVLRLKVANRKITEIETMVTHNQKEGALFKPEALTDPDKKMMTPLDASLRA